MACSGRQVRRLSFLPAAVIFVMGFLCSPAYADGGPPWGLSFVPGSTAKLYLRRVGERKLPIVALADGSAPKPAVRRVAGSRPDSDLSDR
jgi:hypothetical protein